MRGRRFLRTHGLLDLRTLVYFYSRRLRVHAIQELLAGVGVAVAVALVFAVTVANSSIAGSAQGVVRAVIGPADLQLHARGAEGMDESLLSRVEHLKGVEQAAPLLEETATVTGPHGRRATVDVAGTDIGLALLDGLAHTLPLGALSPGGIGLSQTTAKELGLPAFRPRSKSIQVALALRGRAAPIRVSAVLGPETAGALAEARVAVMPLRELQRLADLGGRVSRILVQSKPGQRALVRSELESLAGGRITVAAGNQDVSLLHQALRPSNQASELFAGLSALLGFLFAFNAMLLTVPERREAAADLRLDGTPRVGVAQMVLFQAVCLGIVASCVGLAGGYVLSTSVFHQSPGYLTKAFTLGTSTVIGVQPVILSLAGGVIATILASLVPLQDLRRGRPLDAAFTGMDTGSSATTEQRRWLIAVTGGLVVLASALFVLVPAAAIVSCVLLALATMLAVPLVLTAVLGTAEKLAANRGGLTVLPLALASLKATTMRSLALAATGAVALFGSVALGSSRDDLLRGIDGYTAHYVAGAAIWIVNPNDNQTTSDFAPNPKLASIARVPGVMSVSVLRGSFLDYGDRRIWVIGWPPGKHPGLLEGQIINGQRQAAYRQIGEGGSITVSAQIASEHHVRVGDVLKVPTPTGPVAYKIAATTTNFGWSPGAILMNGRDYAQAWGSNAPSAVGVDLDPGANVEAVRAAIEHELGAGGGVEVLTAHSRQATIDSSASEGLGQLGEIATLLVAAAILAMAAALGSSIWQRRVTLSELRLEGAPGRQLRLVLLVESVLMLTVGCLTGALAGIYGQVVIDGYLKQVTGFPVASPATGQRPLEIFMFVIAAVLLIVSLPGWRASRVPATLALNE